MSGAVTAVIAAQAAPQTVMAGAVVIRRCVEKRGYLGRPVHNTDFIHIRGPCKVREEDEKHESFGDHPAHGQVQYPVRN